MCLFGVQIESIQKNLDEAFAKALDEAGSFYNEFEVQTNAYETLVQNSSQNHELNGLRSSFDQNDFTEDDALMINESINEFTGDDLLGNERLNGAEPARLGTGDKNTLLEEQFNKIETLMNTPLMIDNVTSDLLRGVLSSNSYKFVKCVPDLNGICFGHLKKDVLINTSALPSIDQLDHTKFSLDTQLNENFSFKKQEKCFITFVCPETEPQTQQRLHEYLQVDIYDPHQTVVPFVLSEKFSNSKRYIRICFTPQNAGIFKLSIKFKDIQITNGPFCFVVLSQNVSTTITPSNSSQSIKNLTNLHPSNGVPRPYVKSEPIEPNVVEMSPQSRAKTLAEKLGTNTEAKKPESPQNVPSFSSAGRGRLLKLSDKRNLANGTSTQPPAPSVSQKRKPTDLNNTNQFENSMECDEDDNSMRELSSKLKKCVYVDESINKYHNYPNQTISSIMTLNVHTDINNNTPTSLHVKTGNILSDHLRKYSNLPTNTLVRLLDDKKIPPVKAKFEQKYANLSFPIGVRPCKANNWLIVCDSGNNAVKIFNLSSGELLHQIVENQNHKANPPFTLRRPSAVLIKEDNSEMYIKDDKEILVFSLTDNFKYIRKFGFKMLARPYGLAFDSNKNIVLVDADLKNPIIYTFEKETGKCLNFKPYEPVNPHCAKSSVLAELFSSSGKNVLAKDPAPFERSKIRFISCTNGHLYAADLGRSIVFKTNLDGEMQLAFGFYGKKKGEFIEPSGIHAESDEHAILVGDSKNDRLQVRSINLIMKF